MKKFLLPFFSLPLLIGIFLFPAVSFGATGDNYQYCYSFMGGSSTCVSYADKTSCDSGQSASIASGASITSECQLYSAGNAPAVAPLNTQPVNGTTDGTTGILEIIVDMAIKAGVFVGFLYFALQTTKTLSGAAGAAATKFAGGNLAAKKGAQLRKAAKRETVDRGMSAAANRVATSKFGRNNPFFGGLIAGGFGAAGGNEYDKAQKKKEAAKKKYADQSAAESPREESERRGREEAARTSAEGVEKAAVAAGFSPEKAKQMGVDAQARAILNEEDRRTADETARKEQVAAAHEPGVIQAVAGTTAMNQRIAEEMGQVSARAFNEAIETSIAKHELDNDRPGKEAAVAEATRDLYKIDQAFAHAKANNLSTVTIDAEVKVARAKLDTATKALKPIAEETTRLQGQKKKLGPKEKSVKDWVKEAFAEEKSGAKKEEKKSEHE